MKYKNFYKLEF